MRGGTRRVHTKYLLRTVAVVWLAGAGGIVGEADGATFSNVLPRRDVNGDIVNAHDGQIMKENGTYYWFAAGYVTSFKFSSS